MDALSSAEETPAGVALGAFCRNAATAPVTNGAAIEVPFFSAVAVLLAIPAEVMSTPGANRSTQEP